jgi:hypothetical protein
MLSPEFEEAEARVFAGVSLAEFDAMPGVPDWCNEDRPISKSDVVAHYRLHMLIDAVRDDITVRKMRR